MYQIAPTQLACYVDRVQRNTLASITVSAAAVLALFTTIPAGAQNANKAKAKQQAKAAAPKGGGGGGAYPERPPAPPDVVARGKALFEKECGFCHGEDARGGDMGGNLIRSQIVLNDGSGERLAPILLRGEGVEATLMPKFNFTSAQITDLAGFLHSFRVNGYDISRNRPASIVVGNARDGQAFFDARCTSCHSASGDLKGVATRFADPRTLQQRWLMPAGGRGGGPGAPVTVTVAPVTGPNVNGRLVRIDDFIVTLALDDGTQRTIQRDGDVPRVEIHDPIQAHRELLRVYADKNIHDVTAYLVTLK
jgi:mono/diheme cytochrome c family protein